MKNSGYIFRAFFDIEGYIISYISYNFYHLGYILLYNFDFKYDDIEYLFYHIISFIYMIL